MRWRRTMTGAQKQENGMKGALVTGFIGLLLLPGLCLAAGKTALKNDTERINYSVGHQIGGDFKSQGVELDADALVQGIQDALENKEPLLSPEQMNTTLVKLKKKILADQQGLDRRAAADNRRAGSSFLEENAKRKGVTVLPSGVQYKILKKGSGKKPTLKDDVTVHYRITRVDGKEIGSTYTGGKPRTYPVAKAIPGLQEILPLMAEGAKWQIVLPTGAASGGRDPLDDMGVLIYELELISVKTAH